VRDAAGAEHPKPPVETKPSLASERRHDEQTAGGGPWERRAGRVSPQTREFASVMAEFARRPGVMVAAGSALIAGVALWLGGLLMSFVSSHSIIGSYAGAGHVRFAFFRAAEMTLALVRVSQAGLQLTVRMLPGAFALVTVAAVAIPTALLAPRTRALADRERLLWGAACSLPFAMLMLLWAVIGGSVSDAGAHASVSAGGAFLLGLVWGGSGGVLGVAYAIRRERGTIDGGRLPKWVRASVGTAGVALRPLAAALAVCVVIGTLAWMVQTVRDAGHQRRVVGSPARSTALALLDDVAFAADDGVHLFELGSGVAFHRPGLWGANGMPIPVAKVSQIAGRFSFADYAGDLAAAFNNPPGTFRIFDYSRGIPTIAFVVLLAVMLVPILTAVYAGFALARSRSARTPAQSSARGALVGPIWCVALVIVNALIQKQLGGKASGDSVLMTYLIAGSALGALGGLLASSRSRQPDPRARRSSQRMADTRGGGR
jgi:hypothetical protein